MEALDMTRIAVKALEEKKAKDPIVLDIHEISTIADYFVIASGSNPNQMHAMQDAIEEELTKAGVHPKQIEGNRNASWILMDYQDLIIHLFSEEDRSFYDLERIWSDGKRVEL